MSSVLTRSFAAHRRLAASLVIAATATLAACSGSTDSATTQVLASAPIEIDDITTTSATERPPVTDVLTGTVDASNVEFCTHMTTYQDVSGAGLPVDSGGADPAALRVLLDTMRTELDAMRTSAPAEVRAPVQTYADAVDEFAALVARHGDDLDAAMATDDGIRLAEIAHDADVIAAGQALDDASVRLCGYVPS